MVACAQQKSATNDITQSRIRILMDEVSGAFEVVLCLQCSDPGCVGTCPSGALTKNGETGVIEWDDRRCVGCLLCTVGCAYAGIVYEAEVGHVIKCDICAGRPACSAACAHNALALGTV
ncbi:MAG: hypothetical protein HXX10_14615 [Rhodoplanes sp.]|nr:hypothetical protein [Rhodoplanes sp.]